MKFLKRVAIAETDIVTELKQLETSLDGIYKTMDNTIAKISDDRDIAIGADFKKLLGAQTKVHEALLTLEEYREQLENSK